MSAQRCILEVKEYKAKYAKSVDVYIEETLIRRELSDNFCFYNPNYDNLKGAANWAQETLDVHKKDKRPALLTSQQLEEGKTHDDLWNASQIQLTQTGKMHGFLRYIMLSHVAINASDRSISNFFVVLKPIECTGPKKFWNGRRRPKKL